MDWVELGTAIFPIELSLLLRRMLSRLLQFQKSQKQKQTQVGTSILQASPKSLIIFYLSWVMLITQSSISCRNVARSPSHLKPSTLTPIQSALPSLLLPHIQQTRPSSSQRRWQDRQSRDPFARQARVQGLKSRAAFKLLQMNDKYRLFRPGQTVVDLGYAPGSWSQVGKKQY